MLAKIPWRAKDEERHEHKTTLEREVEEKEKQRGKERDASS